MNYVLWEVIARSNNQFLNSWTSKFQRNIDSSLSFITQRYELIELWNRFLRLQKCKNYINRNCISELTLFWNLKLIEKSRFWSRIKIQFNERKIFVNATKLLQLIKKSKLIDKMKQNDDSFFQSCKQTSNQISSKQFFSIFNLLCNKRWI